MTIRIYIITSLLGLFMAVGCKKPDFSEAPKAQDPGTITLYLQNNFDYTLFNAVVERAGLTDTLNDNTKAFTLFAPVNTAMNGIGIQSIADVQRWSVDTARFFVQSHLLRGRLFYSDIPVASDNIYASVCGQQVFVSRTASLWTVDGVAVTANPALSSATPAYGLAQTNGVVYTLKTALKVSDSPLQQWMENQGDLTHLVAGLKRFGAWDKLAGDGPFTLFATQDSIFERRGITLDSINRMDTSRIRSIVFSGYFITPNHIFTNDISMLPPPSGVIYIPFASPLPGYQLNFLQQGMGTGVQQVADQVLVGPFPNMYLGAPGVTFLLGESSNIYIATALKGTYLNYTLPNAVVHMLADILVDPSKVTKQ